MDCFRIHYDYGYTNSPSWDGDIPPFSYSLWAFFFNIFIGLVMTALISGIIIDTFGERRERSKELSDNSRNVCLICNLPREVYFYFNITI
jgi:hypothetical protein